jgi:hypothetical protein
MLGSALSEMGGALWEMEDELATAHAYQTDAEWTDFLRRVQHGDGEGDQGFYGLKGVDAINAREGVVGAVQEKYQELVESLNPRVRAATVRSMEARYQSFIKTANTFTAGQASVARSGAQASREKASILAAYYAIANGDNEEYNTQIAAVRAQIEESDRYRNATPMEQRAMMFGALENVTKRYIDHVKDTQGEEAAMIVLQAAYADASIGPSTFSDTRDVLLKVIANKGVSTNVDSMLFGSAPPAAGPAPTTAPTLSPNTAGNVFDAPVDSGSLPISGDY